MCEFKVCVKAPYEAWCFQLYVFCPLQGGLSPSTCACQGRLLALGAFHQWWFLRVFLFLEVPHNKLVVICLWERKELDRLVSWRTIIKERVRWGWGVRRNGWGRMSTLHCSMLVYGQGRMTEQRGGEVEGKGCEGRTWPLLGLLRAKRLIRLARN